MVEFEVSAQELSKFQNMCNECEEQAKVVDSLADVCKACASKKGWYFCTPCSKSVWDCNNHRAWQEAHDKWESLCQRIGWWAKENKNVISESIGEHNSMVRKLKEIELSKTYFRAELIDKGIPEDKVIDCLNHDWAVVDIQYYQKVKDMGYKCRWSGDGGACFSRV